MEKKRLAAPREDATTRRFLDGIRESIAENRRPQAAAQRDTSGLSRGGFGGRRAMSAGSGGGGGGGGGDVSAADADERDKVGVNAFSNPAPGAAYDAANQPDNRSIVLEDGVAVQKTTTDADIQARTNPFASNRVGGAMEMLTAMEYSQLRPEQQALARAQAQIWEAVQADKEANSDLDPAARQASLENQEYKSAVEALFGTEGGSNRYAPRTVAILSELGMNDEAGDLDNYLQGNTFVNKQQLMNMSEVAQPDEEAFMMNARRIAETATFPNIAPLLAKGTSILQGVQEREGFGYAAELQPVQAENPLAGLTADQDGALEWLMDGMARPELAKDLGSYNQQIQNELGITPDILESYIRDRLNGFESEGRTFGEGYIGLSEFRERWGVQ